MDSRTANDIDSRVAKILKESGVFEPPVDLEVVLDFLDLYRGYYDLQNPSLLQEIKHKLKIGGHKAKEILGKIDLKGLWFPEEKKILIDNEVPVIKRRWVSTHEIGHRIIPWHKDYVFGDIAETLDPDYHDMIELEANYAASSLLFLNTRFTEEAKDYDSTIKSVQSLAKLYGNSQAMTLRRFAQHSKSESMLAMVTSPHWKGDFLNAGNEELCRYFLPSKCFLEKFKNVTSSFVIDALKEYITPTRGGPVGKGEIILLDDNGEAHSFVGESWFNQYNVLSLITYNKKIPIQN